MDDAAGLFTDTALALAGNLHPVKSVGRRAAAYVCKDHLGAFLKRVTTRHAGGVDHDQQPVRLGRHWPDQRFGNQFGRQRKRISLLLGGWKNSPTLEIGFRVGAGIAVGIIQIPENTWTDILTLRDELNKDRS